MESVVFLPDFLFGGISADMFRAPSDDESTIPTIQQAKKHTPPRRSSKTSSESALPDRGSIQPPQGTLTCDTQPTPVGAKSGDARIINKLPIPPRPILPASTPADIFAAGTGVHPEWPARRPQPTSCHPSRPPPKRQLITRSSAYKTPMTPTLADFQALVSQAVERNPHLAYLDTEGHPEANVPPVIVTFLATIFMLLALVIVLAVVYHGVTVWNGNEWHVTFTNAA
ncbi:hypothetical protein SeMB42_g01309 [Synchytrium endobioticum]|uniref:Uncharacterized protein n=1 Tax=Synchytrium endobioticum TaxID=286115 RepID=A0A507DLX9_9FUNG|nr:hypothetical protein SeLEV6574_g03665 [Synchytrium endobioticum]TPX52593.1 hypothetical protein SeMB42_g01309 [Synchytrium endobioticum]